MKAHGPRLECYKETAPTGVVTLSLAAKIFLIDVRARPQPSAADKADGAD